MDSKTMRTKPNFLSKTGEIATKTLYPVNLSTVILTALYTGILLFIGCLILNIVPHLSLLPTYFLTHLVLGFVAAHFILPAQVGVISEGLLNPHAHFKQCLRFTLRYAVCLALGFVFLWLIGTMAFGAFMVDYHTLLPSLNLFTGITLLGFMKRVVLFYLTIMVLILPIKCLLVAACTKTLKESLSFKRWMALRKARHELLALFILLTGGYLLTFWVYIIPLLAVYLCLFHVFILLDIHAINAYVSLTSGATLLFLAVVTIYTGRLVGWFAHTFDSK